MRSDGRAKMTASILMMAPRAISMHIELIISMVEKMATPKVATKRPRPETMIEGAEVRMAMVAEVFLSLPERRSRL